MRPKPSPPDSSLLLPPVLGVHYQIDTSKLFTGTEIDEFVALYERPDANEEAIHTFLRHHPKFLFALGAYYDLRSEFVFPTKDRSGVGPEHLRLDFLLKDRRGAWDVVELKKSHLNSDAIVGLAQRRRFAVPVQDAVAQVQTYLDELAAPNVQDWFVQSGILLEQPQAWLLIGRDSDLPVAERRRLERHLPRNLRLVTYDELRDLTMQRRLVVTEQVILPLLPAAALGRDDETVNRPPVRRLNLNLSEAAYKALDELAAQHKPSMTELVRQGLRLVDTRFPRETGRDNRQRIRTMTLPKRTR